MRSPRHRTDLGRLLRPDHRCRYDAPPLPHAVSTATLLQDGRVLVSGHWQAMRGGCAGGGNYVTDDWIGVYDPASGVTLTSLDPFTGTGTLAADTDRQYASAVRLPDGRVALIGGDNGMRPMVGRTPSTSSVRRSGSRRARRLSSHIDRRTINAFGAWLALAVAAGCSAPTSSPGASAPAVGQTSIVAPTPTVAPSVSDADAWAADLEHLDGGPRQARVAVHDPRRGGVEGEARRDRAEARRRNPGRAVRARRQPRGAAGYALMARAERRRPPVRGAVLQVLRRMVHGRGEGRHAHRVAG